MLKTVLFDLDGTLLPMDMDVFTGGYFKLLAKKAAPYGYDAEKLVSAVWKGTAAMVRNDGSCRNEEAFWKSFAEIYGQEALKDKPLFDEFYKVEFQEAKKFCGYNPEAKKTVDLIRKAGYRVALATNPLFPAIATESRIEWTGMKASDFEFYTTYENAYHCKPNPDYYTEVLEKLDCKPEECIMVGNDVAEDMIAEKLGMQVFLLTDCLINKDNVDISKYPNGSFDKLREYLGIK